MKKMTIWAAALPVAILVLIAASPSFSDFLTSQFSTTTDKKVAIKSGATLTNIAFSGTMSGGNIAYTTVSPVTFLNQVTANVFNGNLNGDASTADNLSTSANIAFGSTAGPMASSNANNLVFTYNGGALTNLSTSGLDWSTNAVSAAATFPVAAGGIYSLTNAAGSVTFTSVSGTDATRVRWGVMLIDANGSDRTLTLPAAWRVPDGTRTITVTNGNVGILSVNVYANKYTNAFYRPVY